MTFNINYFSCKDLENYMRVKLDPNAAIFFNKGILPRFFNCQADRKWAFSTSERLAVKKLRKLHILQDLNKEQIDKTSISQESQENSSKDIVDFPTTQFSNLLLDEILNSEEVKPTVKNKGIQVSMRSTYRSIYTYCNIMPTSIMREVKDTACSPIKSYEIQDILSSMSTSISNTTKNSNDTLEDCDEYLPSEETSKEASK